MIKKFTLLLFVIGLSFPSLCLSADLGNIGSFQKWSKVEIALTGPSRTATGEPNPFEDDLVSVTFTGPSGQTYVVPGFYNGDNAGGVNGNKWVVRFAADEVGSWTFSSSSSTTELNGYTGTFTCTAASSSYNFFNWGRLEYTGTVANKIRYLKFRDGSYWMKAGCDDPENILGSFSNYDTQAERETALDYLSSKGINSFYIMVNNIDGDANDVWPWMGSTSSGAKAYGVTGNVRFNISKLKDWDDLFLYANQKGIAVYMIMEDDSQWTFFDYSMLYREMVARFGYLPGLIFNLGEEWIESHPAWPSEAQTYATLLANTDPYGHPIAVHNKYNTTTADEGYLGLSGVDMTSIQTDDPYNDFPALIDNWISRAETMGKRIPVMNFDEGRPVNDRAQWWEAYISGGIWEAHIPKGGGTYNHPIDYWDDGSTYKIWTELGGARKFMEMFQFWNMKANNSLVTAGTAYCLENPEIEYALYLPSGGNITVNLPAGSYSYGWWDPSNGYSGSLQNAGKISGGSQQLLSPGTGDWALRIYSSIHAPTITGVTAQPPVSK